MRRNKRRAKGSVGPRRAHGKGRVDATHPVAKGGGNSSHSARRRNSANSTARPDSTLNVLCPRRLSRQRERSSDRLSSPVARYVLVSCSDARPRTWRLHPHLTLQGLVEPLGELLRIRAPAAVGAGEVGHLGAEFLRQRERSPSCHLLT